MKKLAAICIERPVFAAMLILCLVVVGAASYLRLGVDRFPAVDLPDGLRPHARCPAPRPKKSKTWSASRIEEVVNTVEGIDELRSVSGAGSSIVIATFDLDRDIDAAAQDVRDRVATVLRAAAATTSGRRSSASSTTTRSPVLTHRAVGQPAAARADRDRRQDRQGAARALGRRRRSARSSAGSSARSTSGSTPTGWPPTSCRSPRCATRWRSRTPTCPAATSPATTREQTLRTMGRVADPPSLRRPRHRHAQWRADPRPRHRLGRGRHQGAALASRGSTACRRSRSTIRRQSGANTVAVIEGVKAQPRARAGRSCRPTSSSRSSATSRATSTRRCTRSTSTSCSAASSRAWSCFAFMRSWRATIIAGVAIPASVDLDLRDDGGARLHAQQRDDARAGADGRHRHRRRDRRAREHLPLRRREEDGRRSRRRARRPPRSRCRCWRRR